MHSQSNPQGMLQETRREEGSSRSCTSLSSGACLDPLKAPALLTILILQSSDCNCVCALACAHVYMYHVYQCMRGVRAASISPVHTAGCLQNHCWTGTMSDVANHRDFLSFFVDNFLLRAKFRANFHEESRTEFKAARMQSGRDEKRTGLKVDEMKSRCN